jgi:hypothetical protein
MTWPRSTSRSRSLAGCEAFGLDAHAVRAGRDGANANAPSSAASEVSTGVPASVSRLTAAPARACRRRSTARGPRGGPGEAPAPPAPTGSRASRPRSRRARPGRGRGLERVSVADARRDRLVALARRLERELTDGLQRAASSASLADPTTFASVSLPSAAIVSSRSTAAPSGGVDSGRFASTAFATLGGVSAVGAVAGAIGRLGGRARRRDPVREQRERARNQRPSSRSLYRASRPPRGRFSQSRASAHRRETPVSFPADAGRARSRVTGVRADTRQLSVPRTNDEDARGFWRHGRCNATFK